MKRWLAAVLALVLCAAGALAESGVSLDELVGEIDKEAKALTVAPAAFEISPDRQSIFINRPEVTGGSGQYTIAYNIYDANSNPVNYFYSLEDRVAATPGYGGLFNVFVVVTDTATGSSDTQNIGWQELNWPRTNRLTVGRAPYEISPDRKSIFVDRPQISCASGKVTIAYNIYDQQSRPVNYFYSNDKRVAATPGYDGTFNVFVVVTDPGTGEQNTQDIGWVTLGNPAQPDPTAPPTPVSVQVGDMIPLGIYEQNGDYQTKETIDWVVLDVQGSRALVISRKILDHRRFNNDPDENGTWATSSLRGFLNGAFYNTAFTAQEQAAILTTTVDNSPAQGYSRYVQDGCPDTRDKVFLLSYAEAWKYYTRDIDRACAGTPHTLQLGLSGFWNNDLGVNTCLWWLRSPGYTKGSAACVYYDGTRFYGPFASDGHGVRPAMWIDLTKAAQAAR